MNAVILIIISYIVGSIPFGLIVGKMLRGIDIRDHGSGNIGFTNAWRVLGIGPGLLVFIFDVAKGFSPVFAGKIIDLHPLAVIASGLFAIIGHNFSIFLKFRGGKGVATSLGVVIGINPAIAGTAFGIWLVIVAITKYVSVGSILAAASVPTLMWCSPKFYGQAVEMEYRIFALAAAILIFVRHISNIKRLLSGTEPKIGKSSGG